jgi:vacuolar-type H+-ATPase subunit E/Vma4
MPIRDYKRILEYREKNYEEFLEILLEELLRFSKEDQVLLTELISHLLTTDIGDDVKVVLSKMRDDKINHILDNEGR